MYRYISYIDLLPFRTYSDFVRLFVRPSPSYKGDYVQSEFFSLSPIHSIKFKLEFTSINVLFLMHCICLSTPHHHLSLLRGKHNFLFFFALSLTLHVSNTTTSVCVNREQISLYYILIHTHTHQQTHKISLLFVLAYSFVAYIHCFNNNDNSFTRYYLNFIFSLLSLIFSYIEYIYQTYVNKIRYKARQ